MKINNRISLFLMLLCAMFFTACQPILTTAKTDIVEGECLACPAIGEGEHVIQYLAFVSSYNHTTLVPDWVAYELAADEVDGEYTSSSNFSRDPNLQGRQASREDYSHSGWDRGHMVPKADLKWSEQAWWESHYFTNICPQNRKLNGGPWQKLERQVRKWAQYFGKVYVVVGPIFTDNAYGTIGEASVHVPDAFFKALLVPDGDSYASIAFVMGNDSRSYTLPKSAMSVDDLELLLGRDLFPALDDAVEEKIEASYDPMVWGL